MSAKAPITEPSHDLTAHTHQTLRIAINEEALDLAVILARQLNQIEYTTLLSWPRPDVPPEQVSAALYAATPEPTWMDRRSNDQVGSLTMSGPVALDIHIVVLPLREITAGRMDATALAVQLSRSGKTTTQVKNEVVTVIEMAARHLKRRLLWISVLDDAQSKY